MEIRFLTPAFVELDEAVEYYESQQIGVGIRFAAAVEKALSRVTLFPDGYQPVGKYSRRCLVSQFPYGVVYQYRRSESEILVVAIAHLHRLPDYWVSREAQT